MKNNKLFYGLLLIAGMIMFTACGGDSDGGVTASEAPSPTIKDKNGKKIVVTEAGDYTFTYRDNGKLESILCSDYELYEEYKVDKDKFIIRASDDGGNFKAVVSLTSLGFISAMECNEKWNDEEEKGEIKLVLDFEYDKDGHLIRITGEEEYTGTDGEYKWSGNHEYENTIKWSNGNMMSFNSKSSGTETENGEKYQFGSETDCDIEYHKTNNTSKQYSYYQSKILGEELGDGENLFGALAIAGLFGKGTNKLPSHISAIVSFWDKDSEYENEGEENESYNLSFDQNSNGTINYEQNGYSSSNRVYFGYDNAASKAKATRSISDDKSKEQKKRSINRFFKRHRKTQK